MEKRTIFVIGAGRGLGNAIAREFAGHDFRVVLFARDAARLRSYEEEFVNEGIEVYTKTADAAFPETLTKAIREAVAETDTPDVLVYNVGNTNPDIEGEITSEYLISRFQVDVASGYHCVNIINTDTFAAKKGAILFTGGASARTYQPTTTLKALRIDKAALNQMCNILHYLLKPRGIFVGTILIGGAIRQEDPYTNPAAIAKLYWKMFCEREGCEMMCLSSDYDHHVT